MSRPALDDMAAAAGLSGDDAELLALLLDGEGIAPGGIGIPRRPPDEPPALSHGQLRLWFLERLAPGTSVYNVPAAVLLRAPVDVGLVERALNEVVRRHAVLRCAFPADDGRPTVALAPSLHLPLEVIDLPDLPAAEQAEAARRRAEEEARRPFDVARGPLVRAALVRFRGDVSALVVCLHHLVADAWSVGVLVRELWALCDAGARGLPSPLPPLPIQYLDYAAWQRDRVRGEALDRQLAFWRDRLRPPPPALELPADRPRPPIPSLRGERVSSELAPLHARGVLDLARRLGVTPFVVLLAGLDALLARYTGATDLAVGTVFAGRERAELRDLIGFFANTLVLRVDAAGDPTFAELARRVHAAALDAWAHADAPFELVVQSLGLERRLDRAPLFQVAFVYQEDLPAAVASDAPGTPQGRWPLHGGGARFDLTVSVTRAGDRLRLDTELATDLFDRDRVERLHEHLAVLLAAAAAAPDTRVSDLPLLDEAERRAVLALRGPPPPDGAGTRAAHLRFAEQAARRPDAVAAVAAGHAGHAWTYAALATRAAKLAACVRALDVPPEGPVGILLDRSPELVAALLGAWGAGAACLPLDPSLPGERAALQLADAGARVLVTRRALAARLPAHGARLLLVDDPAIEDAAQLPPAAPSSPSSLAYLVYTSGSTGRPKGVAVTHGALDLVLADFRALLDLGPGHRLLAVTRPSFDIAMLELLLPLVAGGTVVLAPEEIAADPRALAAAIEAHGVTTLQTTPSRFRMLVDAGWAGRADLDLLCGGEALAPSLAGALVARGARVFNCYGPSEATVWATVDRVSGGEPVTIGRPLGGYAAYVLDPHLRPLPIGVPGQLHLGGDGLARGYVGNAPLTAARFLPDPFAGGGRRMYATGDLARLRADGRIEFLGRADHQLKIRGFRVEPEEIERALERHPAVRRAAVVPRGAGEAARHLEAHVELAAEAPRPRAEELRAFLAVTLPDYMIPSRFHVAERLPLTPHGKLDRVAIGAAAPAGDLREPAPAEAPRTPTEEVIAALFGELLGIDMRSAREDFFAAGGHSLLATQLVARLRAAFDVDLPLHAVLESPTVAGLAAAVDRARGAPDDVPPIEPRPPGAPAPISADQEEYWTIDRGLRGSPFFVLTSVARLPFAIDPARLQACLDALGERHEALRASFPAVDGRPVQVIAPRPHAALRARDLRPLTPDDRLEEAARAIALERLAPFDLEAGPLVRLALLQLDDEDCVLIAAMHHIVGDAWSMGILMHELEALYRAAEAGEPPMLPPLPFHFPDVVRWREARRADLFAAQRAYWRGRLAGLRRFELPPDHPRQTELALDTARLTRRVSGDRAIALRRFAARRGASPFIALLAAWKRVLARRAGSLDVRVATLAANRERHGAERVIGLFINTLILRTDLTGLTGLTGLAGADAVDELLRRVRATVLDALAHQDLPHDEAVADLAHAEPLARADLARISFVRRARVPFLHAHDAPAPSPESRSRWLGGPEMTATTYDLIIEVDPAPAQIEIDVSWKTALFERGTIEALADEAIAEIDGWIAAEPAPAPNGEEVHA